VSELTSQQFGQFFEAAWSEPGKSPRTPFAWQTSLAERLLRDSNAAWPEAITLPTAAGKTACIDIAVFTLAAQAARLGDGRRITAPRRVFFVVDRRVIVDEAFQRARALAIKLREAQTGILRAVADHLRQLSGSEEPLGVFELRGGMARSESWARWPLQPLVVASTVDQLGSRLLFRGYGARPGMWPILAGLAANDSLILLDEAHCAKPFMETLHAIRKYRGFAKAPLAAPFQVSILSATPPHGLNDVFRDESNQPRNPDHPLGRRQLARKPARLVPPVPAKKRPNELAGSLAREAEEMARAGSRAIVVFCNRVSTARAAHRLLSAAHQRCAVLLTGRMRPLDRDDTISDRLRPLASSFSEHRQLAAPVFVVATQTLEVGADLDFDALVTECASLDALRQRFGRLNRMGRPIGARAAILVRADQADPDSNAAEDPVYGMAIAETWKWLNEVAIDNAVDFGIAHLEGCFPAQAEQRIALLERLNAPSLSAPVMLPAHIDCWVQTAPEPLPTPDVALFLRGPSGGSGDVQVCWRADIELTNEETEGASLDAVVLVPPASGECLPVPLGYFRRWLAGEDGLDDSADIEGPTTDSGEGSRGVRRVVVWRGRELGSEKTHVTSDPRDIRPGDVVVIPAASLESRCLGDLPLGDRDAPVLDLGDRAQAESRGRAVLRLHPKVLGQWPPDTVAASLLPLAEDGAELIEEDPEQVMGDLRSALSELAENGNTEPWLARVAGHLATNQSKTRMIRHPLAGFVLTSARPLPQVAADLEGFSDEDDATSSSLPRRVKLDDHLRGVAKLARRFTASAGLPDDIVEAASLAGAFHDLGKADPRFQALLRGGFHWVRGELLAKSNDCPQGAEAFRQARQVAGYPEAGRHELLSVRFIESVSSLLPADSIVRDLLLHLVATHHGRCRPFAPVVFDDKPVEVQCELEGHRFKASSSTNLECLDSGVADRFWRLTRHYGWWGVAWLEALVRLSDHRQSEWEERSASKGAHHVGT